MPVIGEMLTIRSRRLESSSGYDGGCGAELPRCGGSCLPPVPTAAVTWSFPGAAVTVGRSFTYGGEEWGLMDAPELVAGRS